MSSCIDTSNEQEQTIKSPNFPSWYGENRYCTWKIEAPVGKVVRLEFFSHDIGIPANYDTDTCNYDSLKVNDGSSSTSNLLAGLCGMGNQSEMTSTGNTLHLEFESRFYFGLNYTGFSLHYSFLGILDNSSNTCVYFYMHALDYIFAIFNNLVLFNMKFLPTLW